MATLPLAEETNSGFLLKPSFLHLANDETYDVDVSNQTNLLTVPSGYIVSMM